MLFYYAQVKELGIRFLASRVFPTETWCVANFAHFVRRALEGVNAMLGSIERDLR